MACEVDWGALGTWVTGFAAIWIAVMTHRFAAAVDRREAKANRRRRRAYRVGAHLQIRSLRRRAEAVSKAIRAALEDANANLWDTLQLVADAPSFEPTAWLSESDAIGFLPTSTIDALSHALSAASDAERARALIERAQTGAVRFQGHAPGATQLLSGFDDALRDLMSRAGDAEALLKGRD